MVSTFHCPSDPGSFKLQGLTSYAGSIGDALYMTKFNGAFGTANGDYIYLNLSAVTDGMSQTSMMSEWLPGGLQPGDDPRRFIYQALYRDTPADIDRFTILCQEKTRTGPPLLDRADLKGEGWYMGGWTATLYDHGLPINHSACEAMNPGEFLGSCAAGSLHPSGVNCLMLDGHLSMISAQIQPKVWRALGTRSGGEVVGAGDF